MARAGRTTDFLVIGLGRFGGGVARTLVELGNDVLGVDLNAKNVQAHRDVLTHVVEADATDVAAMRQLGAGDFETAVVAIGTDIEASILTTAVLVDLGVPRIVAKAVSEAHGKILERVGANRVVHPERDTGVRVGHSLTGSMIDFIQLDPGFALVETTAPKELVGRSLADAEVRRRYGITVVCIKPAAGSFTYATPETVVNDGDVLVVAGETGRAEAFGALA
ncbi:MAG: TrkA family potassium uptake protein [Actinomycetota bacterium]|nr:TrkA family potassium uptake protein [Actinomycetota bacterium]